MLYALVGALASIESSSTAPRPRTPFQPQYCGKTGAIVFCARRLQFTTGTDEADGVVSSTVAVVLAAAPTPSPAAIATPMTCFMRLLPCCDIGITIHEKTAAILRDCLGSHGNPVGRQQRGDAV